MIAVPLARKLKRPLRLITCGLLAYFAYHISSAGINAVSIATLIAAAAILPSYIWTTGTTHGGLPLFPIMALTFVSTSAMPFLAGHAALREYTEAEWAAAAGATTAFLLIGTLTWYRVSAVATKPPATYRGFDDNSGIGLFDAFLGFAVLTHTSLWWEIMPAFAGSMYSTIRAISLCLAVLAVTVLSYRWGAGRLGSAHKVFISIMIIAYCAVEMAGLMVHGALSTVMVACIGYTLGRGRPPVLMIVIALCAFSVLHVGKWPMRAQYWNSRDLVDRQEDYISFYGRWFGYGLTALAEGKVGDGKGQNSSALDRASLIQMLLLVQRKSPNPVPYLDGDTYYLIPELLIPRIFYSQKAWANEGTYRLSIAYGLQKREEVRTTTIGFGPLAEAYANFGIIGVLGLGAVSGAALGWVSRLSRHVPITSLRGLWALTCLTSALQSESTLGVSLSSLFQASLLLIGMSLFLMKPQFRKTIP